MKIDGFMRYALKKRIMAAKASVAKKLKAIAKMEKELAKYMKKKKK